MQAVRVRVCDVHDKLIDVHYSNAWITHWVGIPFAANYCYSVVRREHSECCRLLINFTILLNEEWCLFITLIHQGFHLFYYSAFRCCYAWLFGRTWYRNGLCLLCWFWGMQVWSPQYIVSSLNLGSVELCTWSRTT